MRRLARTLLLSSLALLPLLSPADAAAETVLRRGIGSSPGTIDPGKADLHPESIVIYDLYEGLLAPGPDGAPVPGAAEKWQISPDGKTYTFTLRANGRWSDGSPVTAKDFVHAWRRLASPAQASPYAYYVWPIVNGREVTAGTKPPTALGVEAVDDLTFKVHLVEPAAYFLGQVAHQSMSPVKDGAPAGRTIGNGAYMLAESVPQSHYKLVKNPHFRDAATIRVDTVFHTVTENVDTELKRYRAGELDVTYTLPVTAVDWARKEAADAYMPTPTYSTYFLALNLTHEPWKSNPKLRAALSMAVDREVIVNKVLNGDLRPAYSFTPPGKVAGYEPPQPDWAALPQSERDTLAKKLMTEAGFGPGKPPPPVEILMTQNENNKRVMIAVAAMWKQKLGVDTVMNNQEFRVVSSIGNQKTYKDALYYGWIGDFPDPINFLKLLRSDVAQQNYPAYENKDYDALLDMANASLDPAVRLTLLAQAERLYQADVPLIPIFHNTRRRLVNPRVVGWTKAPLDQNPTRFLDVKG